MKNLDPLVGKRGFTMILLRCVKVADVLPCFRRFEIVLVRHGKRLKRHPGLVCKAQFHLREAEIVPRFGPLGGRRVGADELPELLRCQLIQAVVVQVQGKLEISILLGVLGQAVFSCNQKKHREKQCGKRSEH